MFQQSIAASVWIALFMVAFASGEHWAVIVVGSTGYWNYRHQSDACHSYHVVKGHGIPESNIILMMYDDVVNSTSNPFPGKLFNRPSKIGLKAVDVYDGCKVDYRGNDVTPKKFLQVLSGDESAGGKVLKSKSTDRVFVNFIDHGAQGFVVFPKETLSANDLMQTIEVMNKRNLYKELVFYMEACESGSMFKDLLPNNINVFVTTAANDHESSWATYCPPFGDIVNGRRLNTCLGDLYSVNWMEDSDKTDLSIETILTQYDTVKKKTKKSHVEKFGSTRIPNEPVGDFQSNIDTDANPSPSVVEVSNSEEDGVNLESLDVVNAHDVELVTKFYQYIRATTLVEKSKTAQALIDTIKEREVADALFAKLPIVAQQLSPEIPKDKLAINSLAYTACVTLVNAEIDRKCGGYNDYSLQYAAIVASLCQKGYTGDVLVKSVQSTCKGKHMVGSSVFNVDNLQSNI